MFQLLWKKYQLMDEKLWAVGGKILIKGENI